MSNYPDDFHAKLCDAAFGDGPWREYPEPEEISKFIKELSIKMTLQIAAEFDNFHNGSAFELDANLSERIEESIDEAAYRFFKQSKQERET